MYNLVRLDALTVLEKPADTCAKSFFSEIVASISDIKSTPDGRYIVSRDYMTLKLWDVNMEARPVKTINVHEHLRPQVRLASYTSSCGLMAIMLMKRCDVITYQLATATYARVGRAKTSRIDKLVLSVSRHKCLGQNCDEEA